MNKQGFDKYLRNKLDYICDFSNGYQHTDVDVYGKNVRIYDKTGQQQDYELQNWYITLQWKDSYNTEQFIDHIKFLAQQKELDEIYKFRTIPAHQNLSYKNIVVEQLCDWQWLEGEDGKILQGNDTVTIVKYAVVVYKEGDV